MPFHTLSEDERRSLCRATLESLELWIRRLINDQLSKEYGANYLNAQDAKGQSVINTRIRKLLTKQMMKEPKRYERQIDAALLDTEIDILCNPNLYNSLFKEAMHIAFPDGRQAARTSLLRLLPI